MLPAMPSHLHEVFIEMFRERPVLAAELLREPLHGLVPDFRAAHVSPGDLTDVAPTEYRADAVVTLDGDADPVLAVVVEVQLRVDPRKRQTWPAYVATAHARLRCPVVLLVICRSQAIADWSAAPIEFGPPGNVVTPIALGPRQIPVVTDVETARRLPELAVMSAIAHGAGADPTPIFEALLTAFDAIDLDHADWYADVVLAALPMAARDRLEEFMTTTGQRRYQSEFANRYFSQGEAKGRAEGEARGEAEALLRVLSARGIAVPDDVRTRFVNCTDVDQLGAWIERAATADKIDDLDV